MSKLSKRRKKFVDRAVQGALVRRLIFHWFAFIVTSLALGIILQALSDPFKPVGDHLHTFFQKNFCIFLAILLMTPVFIIDTIKLSNRFAGPIFRLRREMQALNRGEQPKPLKFRPNDFWQELAEEFNGIANRIESSESSSDEEEPALSV